MGFQKYVLFFLIVMLLGGCKDDEMPLDEIDNDTEVVSISLTSSAPQIASIQSIVNIGNDEYIFAGCDDGGDIALIRYNEAKEIEVLNTFGGVQNENVYDLLQTNDGGFILAGSTRSFGAGANDAYLIKTDKNGVE